MNALRTEQICSIDGCSSFVQARALCTTHYQRLRAHGDPLIALRDKSKHSKTCKACGQRFTFGGMRGRTRVFCSDACHRSNSKTRIEHSCLQCGKLFFPRKSEYFKYCSNRCGGIANSAVGVAGRLVKAAQKALLREPVYESSRVGYRECKSCAALFTVSKFRNVGIYYCSSACVPVCRKAGCVHEASKWGMCIAHHAERQSRNAPRPQLIRTLVCLECDVSMQTKHLQKKFCCGEHRDRYHKRAYKPKRRAVERAAYVEDVMPYVVFKRDKWTCRICGVNTPRKQRGSYEPNAPELDHIVPLSAGGAHSYANTQCACRACNCRKGGTLPGVVAA